MKKVLFSALLATAAAMPASAGIFKYGIEAGLNLNKMSVNSTFDSENQAGWFAGPKVQLTVPLIGLMIDGSLQYSQSKMSLGGVYDESVDEYTCKKTLPYIVVPLNLKYGIGLGSQASVYLSTGPQWNWYVGGSDFKMALDEFDVTRNTFYWNFGLGLHLLGHLQVGATYNLGFGKSFAEVKDSNAMEDLKNIDWKNNGWQVRVAYMF